jgi:hypothetical protein
MQTIPGDDCRSHAIALLWGASTCPTKAQRQTTASNSHLPQLFIDIDFGQARLSRP